MYFDIAAVFAIERQRGVDEHAALRADRQPFDLHILRSVLADAEHLGRRTRVRDRRPPAR